MAICSARVYGVEAKSLRAKVSLALSVGEN